VLRAENDVSFARANVARCAQRCVYNQPGVTEWWNYFDGVRVLVGRAGCKDLTMRYRILMAHLALRINTGAMNIKVIFASGIRGPWSSQLPLYSELLERVVELVVIHAKLTNGAS